MKKIFLALFVLCILALSVSSQQQRLRVAEGDVLISHDKPTIYITFERSGKRKPLYDAESNQGIWLRLHNNTQWAIHFCTQSLYVGQKVTPLQLRDGRGVLGLREGVEVSPCHGVEVVDRYESQRIPK
jgi:hypothetical protein